MISPPVSPKTFPRWIFPFALALCAYTILALYSLKAGRLPLGIWWSVQAVGWISCAWFLRTVTAGWPATPWIVASALAFRVCGLWATPTLEDDYQRYLWDGWRTIQDGSPYDRAPQEFFSVPEKRPPGIETALNELNNPDLTTIYAPVTQLLFAAAAAIAPGSLLTLKLFLLLIDFGILLLLLASGGRRAAWFYGWCPLVVTENAFHAHPEAWALLWLIAAWICANRQRYLFAGALAGIAVGAKIFALLAVPFLAWRRPAVVGAGFLAALGLIYGPILASGSSAEWAGLHAMAGYFEFNSFGFALLARLCGPSAARVLWLILFGLIAALLFARWAWQKRSPAPGAHGRCVARFFPALARAQSLVPRLAGSICGRGSHSVRRCTLGGRAAELCDRTQSWRSDAGDLCATSLGAASGIRNFCSRRSKQPLADDEKKNPNRNSTIETMRRWNG